MNPETKGDVEPKVSLQPTDTSDKTIEQSKGFIKNIIKKISENKMYQYIAIGILILVVVAFFYFKKSKKDLKSTNKNQPLLPQPKKNNESSLSGLNNEDRFILDSNGNPVKVSESNHLLPLPIPKQQPSQQDIQMLQKQMQEKQMQEQMMHQQMMHQQMMHQQMMHQQMMQQQNNSRPKLQHPESDLNMSDNIDVDLAKIQANEDENVAQHNLTNSELAEINNKIEMMSSQK
jgi:hypothetical protein